MLFEDAFGFFLESVLLSLGLLFAYVLVAILVTLSPAGRVSLPHEHVVSICALCAAACLLNAAAGLWLPFFFSMLPAC